MTGEFDTGGRAAGRWRYAPLVVVLVGLATGYALGWQHYLTLDYLAESRQVLKDFAADNPVLAPLGFMAIYTAAVACSFPAASIMTVFGGFLFGWLLGGIYAIVAATVGATIIFMAARTVCGSFLRRRVGGLACKLSDGFEKNAFGYLLVLRLAPFAPFFIVNVAPALFNVRLRTYVAATFIGIIPGGFAYAWLGQGCDSVLMAAETAGQQATIRDLVTPQITIAFLALALVAALATVVKRMWASRI
ncbi:TVP38/TMEM64 family protein [Mesorhizobium soli]|uniref:TVP38/TMEM64 family membrane protein n=2 Tax=Pseudaminobacter soli (ex Li et al. 2025) TaxID=1295366 RepID=A0A2P7S4R2_9HYPH|nr:TVP38/TMEM64 family protein [Mesorhizobium soli]